MLALASTEAFATLSESINPSIKSVKLSFSSSSPYNLRNSSPYFSAILLN
jgi:hypothetical protein